MRKKQTVLGVKPLISGGFRYSEGNGGYIQPNRENGRRFLFILNKRLINIFLLSHSLNLELNHTLKMGIFCPILIRVTNETKIRSLH